MNTISLCRKDFVQEGDPNHELYTFNDLLAALHVPEEKWPDVDWVEIRYKTISTWK
jgi:hypothetical protein